MEQLLWFDVERRYLNYREEVGRQLAELRIKKGMTTQQVAENAGITSNNVCKIEQGRYNVGIDILGKVATTLGATIKIEETKQVSFFFLHTSCLGSSAKIQCDLLLLLANMLTLCPALDTM